MKRIQVIRNRLSVAPSDPGDFDTLLKPSESDLEEVQRFLCEPSRQVDVHACITRDIRFVLDRNAAMA